MAKTNNATDIGTTFRIGSSAGVSAFLDRWAAVQFLNVILLELRAALDASADHQDLIRRSTRQLTRMGLNRADIPRHIHKRYYG